MRVLISGLSFRLTGAIARHIEEAIEAALGSASRSVDRVAVRLDDINGARGGQDKRCRIVLWLRRAGAVVAHVIHRDLYAAVEQAAGKAAHLVRRRQSRSRSLHRTCPPWHGQQMPA